jgi:hypothetical protein
VALLSQLVCVLSFEPHCSSTNTVGNYICAHLCVFVNSVKLSFGQNKSLHWTIQLSFCRPMWIDLLPLLFFYPPFQLMMHMETCIQHVTESHGHVDWFSSFPFSFFLFFLAGVAQIHLFGIFSFSLVSGLTYGELYVMSPKTMWRPVFLLALPSCTHFSPLFSWFFPSSQMYNCMLLGLCHWPTCSWFPFPFLYLCTLIFLLGLLYCS